MLKLDHNRISNQHPNSVFKTKNATFSNMSQDNPTQSTPSTHELSYISECSKVADLNGESLQLSKEALKFKVYINILDPNFVMESYDQLIVKYLLKIVRKGDYVADIGANIGLYSLLFSRLVGSSGKVWAMELCHETQQILQKNLECNSVNNVEVISIKDITTATNENNKDFYTFAVQKVVEHIISTTLPVSFIKIDIPAINPEIIQILCRFASNSSKFAILLVLNAETTLKNSCYLEAVINTMVDLKFSICPIGKNKLLNKKDTEKLHQLIITGGEKGGSSAGEIFRHSVCCTLQQLKKKSSLHPRFFYFLCTKL